MMDTGPREEEVRPANEVFTLLSEGHGLAVILDALASREGVGDETRSELSARIRKLRIKGFRDANRAPHDRLVETILDAIAKGDHRLAAAILATWMQTHSVLRERAAAHLRGRGIEVVDAPPVRFTSCWDTDEWLLERNRMLRDSDGAPAHRDDAALMLSLVSGRFPGPPFADFQGKEALVVTPEQRARVAALAEDFPRLWNAPTTKAKDKKRILRLLIKDITVERFGERKTAVLHVRWQGGACEDLEVTLPANIADRLRYPDEVVDRVRELARERVVVKFGSALRHLFATADRRDEVESHA